MYASLWVSSWRFLRLKWNMVSLKMRQNISEIKLEMLPTPSGRLIGHASFLLDGKIRLNGLAIFSRPDGGVQLEWPNKTRGIKRVSTAYPIKKDVGEDIEAQIFEAIKSEIQE